VSPDNIRRVSGEHPDRCWCWFGFCLDFARCGIGAGNYMRGRAIQCAGRKAKPAGERSNQPVSKWGYCAALPESLKSRRIQGQGLTVGLRLNRFKRRKARRTAERWYRTTNRVEIVDQWASYCEVGSELGMGPSGTTTAILLKTNIEVNGTPTEKC
jgi:hypothetical protein